MKPLTREELQVALEEMFDVANKWEDIIECDEDENGFPKGDSIEANMKRMILDITSRMGRISVALSVRGMTAAPPEKIEVGQDRTQSKVRRTPKR